MTVFGYALDNCLMVTENGYGNHNIFLPMFLTGVIISTIELFLRDRKKGTLLLIAIFLVQFLYYTVQFGNVYIRNRKRYTVDDDHCAAIHAPI